jgi:hypothetical protein
MPISLRRRRALDAENAIRRKVGMQRDRQAAKPGDQREKTLGGARLRTNQALRKHVEQLWRRAVVGEWTAWISRGLSEREAAAVIQRGIEPATVAEARAALRRGGARTSADSGNDAAMWKQLRRWRAKLSSVPEFSSQ